MLNANVRNAFASASGSTFGQMWRAMIRRFERPSMRAASTYGRDALVERRAAHDARVDRREEDHEQPDREEVAAAEDADDDDRDEQRRHRVDEIDPARDRRVGEPAEVAGEQAEHVPDQHRAERDQQRPDDGGARADDRARDDVAAEVVRAEQVLAARARQAVQEVLLVRVVRRDPRPEGRADDDGGEDDDGERRPRARSRGAPAARRARPQASRRPRRSRSRPCRS